MKRIVVLMIGVLLSGAAVDSGAPAQGKYKNFRVAIYVLRNEVSRWADRQNLESAYERMSHQVKYDKVYLEFASGRQMLDEATLAPIKKFFSDRGILVSAAIVPNQLSYANPADMDYLKKIITTAARHFDEVILDDWYFTASKTAADIAAKGNKSWTQYRMDALDDAAKSILIKDSKAINPKFRLIIKFPNWYEHYQGLGYDVAVEPTLFDGVYTGVETRDPIYSEQHLQQYESYSLMRYFENSRPGGTDGGWVDQLGTRYIDRYAEQIWEMAFAKPREITLWQWAGALQPINVGTRPWEASDTSLNLQKVRDSYQGDGSPLTGRIAGYAMEQVDTFVDKLGKPIGIAAYRPPHAVGEEFLYDYLGMIGIPIEFSPSLSTPTDSDVCLLTEGSKYDPDIIKKIKAQLAAGKNIVVTSGLLRALSGKGIEDISEFEITDQSVGVTDFMARMGRVIPDATVDSPIFFPVIHFLTNQSWSQVSGFDGKSPQNSYPILLYDAYDRGHFFVLSIPDNVADLYRLPEPVLNTIRSQIMGTFPIRLTSAPSQVSIFAYDNNTFVVQSFLPAEVKVTVSIGGTGTFSGVTDLLSGQTIAPAPRSRERSGFFGGFGGRVSAPPGTNFAITVPPHSYRAFTAKN